MSVAVFLPNQNTNVEAPAHKANASLVALMVAGQDAIWIVRKKIAVLARICSWAALKQKYAPLITASNSAPIPRLLAPLEYYDFNTNYPPAGQETDARARQARLWAGNACVPYRERVTA